jgi:hypothetical protein
MNLMNKWEDYTREDLHNIPYMESQGFSVEFHRIDKHYGRTVPQSVPHWPVSFRKGDMRVWSIRDGWQTSFVTGDGSKESIQHRYHKRYKTLKEASKRPLTDLS